MEFLPYHVLTDTNSTALAFIILCAENNSILDSKFSDIIFEVIVQSDIIDCFDTSHKFWERFLARGKSLAKKLSYFEGESINNPCQIVITVNPKEYYVHFESFSSSKRHKDIRKDERGMEFDNFAARIAPSRQIDNSEAPKNEYVKQLRFTIVGGKMQQTTIEKKQIYSNKR